MMLCYLANKKKKKLREKKLHSAYTKEIKQMRYHFARSFERPMTQPRVEASPRISDIKMAEKKNKQNKIIINLL